VVIYCTYAGVVDWVVVVLRVVVVVVVAGSTTAPFVLWLGENNVVGPATLEITDNIDGDRGLVAKQDIEAGQVIASVPSSIMLTSSSLQQSSIAQAVAEYEASSGITISTDDRIALMLLHEKHLGTSSRFAHFIAVLPQSYTNLLNFELHQIERLKGSNLYFLASRVQSQTLQDYEQVLAPLLTRYAHLHTDTLW
jgi:hypothetical protein